MGNGIDVDQRDILRAPYPLGADAAGGGLVIVPWTIGGLLSDLTARGEHPAVISFGEDGVVTWGSEALADKALSLARGLRENGVDGGSAVALWAPNSPVWIAAALGVLAADGILVPIDDLADAEQFEAALNSSGDRLILTTARHLDASGATLRAHGVTAIRVEEGGRSGPGATAWQALANKRVEDLPVPANDEPAMLSWTSGTTGSPKAFILTHRNIASNVEALQKLAVVGPRDRALLPLPLHHVCPFVVGMLTTFALGTTIILPAAVGLDRHRFERIPDVPGLEQFDCQPRFPDAHIQPLRQWSSLKPDPRYGKTQAAKPCDQDLRLAG